MTRDGHGPRTVKLGRLLPAAPAARLRDGSAATEIAGLAYDSRAVRPGFLFCALPGEKTDGGLYAEEAERRGAVAVLHQNGLRPPRGVADVAAPDARTAITHLAAEFYGRPSAALLAFYDASVSEPGYWLG